MAELGRFSTYCKFEAFLDEALCNRLVCGLHNEAIQKKLITAAELDLAKAIDLSVGIQATDKNARFLKESDTTVNRVTPHPKPCYHYGQKSHNQKVRKFQNAECHNCGKRRHSAPVSRSLKKHIQIQHEQANREGLV